MIFKSRVNDPAAMIRVGSASLILANASHWFLHPGNSVMKGLADGITGALFGLSIGFLLLGARLNARRQRGDESRPCG